MNLSLANLPVRHASRLSAVNLRYEKYSTAKRPGLLSELEPAGVHIPSPAVYGRGQCVPKLTDTGRLFLCNFLRFTDRHALQVQIPCVTRDDRSSSGACVTRDELQVEIVQ